MKVLIVGASIGGLVAAAIFRKKGFEVTIIERGNKVSGLYQSVDTPFGKQELGMHVVYVNEEIKNILKDIYGLGTFITLKNKYVDLASTYFNNELKEKSVYPIFDQFDKKIKISARLLLNKKNMDDSMESAHSFFERKFGSELAKSFYKPVLESLWGSSSELLSRGASQCYFDLRRICLFSEITSKIIKKFSRFDNFIANPNQLNPSTPVYENREAIVFDQDSKIDLQKNTLNWIEKNKIKLCLNTPVSIKNDGTIIFDGNVKLDYDALLMTGPIHSIIEEKHLLEMREMSIAYFKFPNPIMPKSNCYYTLCHQPDFSSSRIVNYYGYKKKFSNFNENIVSVEVLHKVGERPPLDKIIKELNLIYSQSPLPNGCFLERNIKLPKPTLINQELLNSVENKVKKKLQNPYLFSAMRTDKGHFFQIKQ